MELTQAPNFLGHDNYVPAFQISVEGSSMPPAILKSIMQISIKQVINAPSSFSLQVNDPDFRLIDTADMLLAEGKRLEIFMGYAGNTKKLIEGEITALGAEFDETGGLSIQVEGFDALHAATRGTQFREFRPEQTDSQIVADIARELKLNAKTGSTVARQDHRIQNHVSNLEFLSELAEANGFSFWVEENTLFFQPRREGSQVIVARGKNLLSFSTRLSTAGHVPAVEVRGWDVSRKEPISARALIDQAPEYNAKLSLTGLLQIKGQSSKTPERVIYADGRIKSVAEAKARADAEINKQRRNLLTADGSSIGNTDIQPGSALILSNMGRFSGNYIVNAARHDISQSGYRTSFELSQYL
jgi:phage protein D